MFEILPESQGNIIGVRASGKLTVSDYKDVLIPKIEAVSREQGKVRCLFLITDDFSGWETGSAGEDVSLAMRHSDKIEKIALVGMPKWIMLMSVKYSMLLRTAQIEMYLPPQEPAAWGWIKA